MMTALLVLVSLLLALEGLSGSRLNGIKVPMSDELKELLKTKEGREELRKRIYEK